MRAEGRPSGGGASRSAVYCVALAALLAGCGSNGEPSQDRATPRRAVKRPAAGSTARAREAETPLLRPTRRPATTAPAAAVATAPMRATARSSPRSSGKPRLFFSDLESGPGSGGQGGKGAFVSIWGAGFGATRGSSTVTIGGGAADNYPVWTNTKITFQLGAAAATGNIVVHVSGKADSNGSSFTVSAAATSFSVTSRERQRVGKSSARSLADDRARQGQPRRGRHRVHRHERRRLGVTDRHVPLQRVAEYRPERRDQRGHRSAAQGARRVPRRDRDGGAGERQVQRGLLVPAITGTFDYWVLSGLTLRGQDQALDFEGTADGWRVIGNDVSCPNGTGLSGCIVGGDGTTPHDLKLFGNVVHDAAANVTTITKYYHGIYLASNDLEPRVERGARREDVPRDPVSRLGRPEPPRPERARQPGPRLHRVRRHQLRDGGPLAGDRRGLQQRRLRRGPGTRSERRIVGLRLHLRRQHHQPGRRPGPATCTSTTTRSTTAARARRAPRAHWRGRRDPWGSRWMTTWSWRPRARAISRATARPSRARTTCCSVAAGRRRQA